MERKTHLVLDVETIGDSVVFDIAWSLGTKDGIIHTQNFLVKEVYGYDKIASFPFHGAKKAERYDSMVNIGALEVLPWREILLNLWEDITTYRISTVWAYNIIFDVGAIKKTNRLIRKKEFNLFDCVNVFDLYTAFCLLAGKRKGYRRFCEENEQVSEAGNIRTKAETAIRYIRQDVGYDELHTAGQDTIDEFEILQFLFKSKKKRNCEAIASPWKLAQ